MSGHHPATVRLAGRKRHARFERALSTEALAGRAAGSGAHSRGAAWMLRQGVACTRRSSSANILTAWPGRVAQAPRAGRARAPWSCSPCWRPSSRTARFRDQLGLDDEVNSEIADRYATGSSARRGVVAVGDSPTSSVSAVQLIPETMGSESLRALESCAPLAPSQPHSRCTVAG
jgi:hypothetical protein